MCVCMCVRLAVTRPQCWPFPCQDKHRCHTAGAALHARLRGNKPEPQPCGSLGIVGGDFPTGNQNIVWEFVLQQAADVLRLHPTLFTLNDKNKTIYE